MADGPFDPIFATRLVRSEWSRMVAVALRILGDLDLAQDIAQETLLAAVRTWPTDGIPANTGAWLATVARRRALNQLRSRTRRGEVALPDDMPGSGDPPLSEDDRLALVLLCCHPSLSHDAKVTLTLRLAGGLSTREIARGFVANERAIGQRIARAKRHLRSIPDPLKEPEPEDMGPRIEAVLEVVYLIFNEGYLSDTNEAVRGELMWEAAMLADQLTQLAPDLPEVWGLAALIHLKTARTATRLSPAGQLVPLDEQDRRLWDREAIRRGERCRSAAVGAARRGVPVGAYVLQAEIEAHHCRAERFADTDWPAIDTLYEALVDLTGNAVAKLGWAVARSYAVSPGAGLALLDQHSCEQKLRGYDLAAATRADMLRRKGDLHQAARLYRTLHRSTASGPQRDLYARRLAECEGQH